MRRSFEELIGHELDRLYRAALFLSGGRVDRAERLLQSAALRAFREYGSWDGPPDRAGRWLDQHLARTFLHREASRTEHGLAQAPQPEDPSEPAPGWPLGGGGVPVVGELELEDLARAGGALAPHHRVAFWLAVVERRKYGDISAMMEAPRDLVSRWIREAHRRLAQTLSTFESRRPTQRGRRHEM